MDLLLKRKFDQVEDEDEWEREVERFPKRQRNPYATQINILDKQYTDLTEIYNDLQKQLHGLENELAELQQEEETTDENIDKLKQQHDDILNTIMESIGEETDSQEEEDYFENDEELSLTVNHVLKDWQTVLEKEATIDDIDLELDNLGHSFQANEFDIIDLNAQIEGYKSRIQCLYDDREIMTGLPQGLSMLESDIKEYQDEIDSANKMLEKFEKDTIRPCLIRLNELNINIPLEQLQQRKDIATMKDLLHDLDMIYSLSLKQRAYQQLTSYLYDDELEDDA
ncbi:hypothetical protein RMCBS344292_19430 [Rhizopus microsporus]|nr:hypothetical protein RMCBS344292_19430 [Rhizopus microsporus]